MTVVRVYQPHTFDFMSNAVKDAASILGERIVYCEMWNTQNAPKGMPRCKYCYDDVYGESDTTGGICKYCFGTTYKGGIKAAHFTNAIMSSPDTTSTYHKEHGEFDTENLTCQVSDDIKPHEKDYILRIAGWYLQGNQQSLSVGDAAYMTVDEYALYGRQWQKGLKADFASCYKVRRSFNDAYIKDGFHYLGQQNRVGAQIPIGYTDQKNPIVNITLSNIPGQFISDNIPFVAYSPYAEDVPEHSESNGLMTVGQIADYTVKYFNNANC